jgi:hypothetical protein
VRFQDLEVRMLERLREEVPAEFVTMYEGDVVAEPQLA